MTDLTTKTAQSLHAEWCRQMREKGFHGPNEDCTYDVSPDNPLTYQHQREVRYSCKKDEGMKPNGDTFPYRCGYYHPNLIPWPDLPESRRQEYLATAKAVLPEIVESVFTDAMDVVERTKVLHGDHYAAYQATSNNAKELVAALLYQRDRRLEELK